MLLWRVLHNCSRATYLLALHAIHIRCRCNIKYEGTEMIRRCYQLSYFSFSCLICHFPFPLLYTVVCTVLSFLPPSHHIFPISVASQSCSHRLRQRRAVNPIPTFYLPLPLTPMAQTQDL